MTTITSPACNGGRQITLAAGQGFVNNQIAPARLNSAALIIQKRLPVPTDPCGRVQFGLRSNSDEHMSIVKMDYQINSKHSMFGRASVSLLDVGTTYDGKNALTLNQDSGHFRSAALTLGDTYVIGSSMVNSFRIGATRMDAPSRLVQGSWTVDQIPAGRLVAPLVILDASASVKSNPDYEISVEDIVRWEQTNGQIPLGAVVMARTGWGSRWDSPKSYRNTDARGNMHFPGYTEDAARFLAEGRNALGLGIDTPNLQHGGSKTLAVNQYTLAHGLYVLTNVANLDRMPANGAVAMVAPVKVTGGSTAPVRILALVR
jgi:kynurenine formamidase